MNTFVIFIQNYAASLRVDEHKQVSMKYLTTNTYCTVAHISPDISIHVNICVLRHEFSLHRVYCKGNASFTME